MANLTLDDKWKFLQEAYKYLGNKSLNMVRLIGKRSMHTKRKKTSENQKPLKAVNAVKKAQPIASGGGKRQKSSNAQKLTIAGFSFFSAYILSFPFEGQVLYSVFNMREADPKYYILAAITTRFLGLFTGGFFIRSLAHAKKIMFGAVCLCFFASAFFFFSFPALWMSALVIIGYISGCAVAAWGYFLRAFIPKNNRIKSCADVLIYSNILMIAATLFVVGRSPIIGLCISMIYLVISVLLIWILPLQPSGAKVKILKNKADSAIKKPLILLFLFTFIFTINSGLMHQVISPAFNQLKGYAKWYWILPYIVAIAILRNIPEKRSITLYIAITMTIGASICFMLLGRQTLGFIAVETLMLGACGIFDLFCWSILVEMLDYTDSPALIFGIGLSAKVFGILFGKILGMAVVFMELPYAEVAVIALTVVCVTLIMVPALNSRLGFLLTSHIGIEDYKNKGFLQQKGTARKMNTLDPLTAREQDVLQLILSGKSNREIAGSLFISENTVKTHTRSIFSKYDVGSRAVLISSQLKRQIGENI